MKATKNKTVQGKIAQIPNKDIELCAVAASISQKWALHPSWQLEYTTAAQFAEKVLAFDAGIDSKMATQSSRPGITGNLRACMKEMDQALDHVKAYLREHYEKEPAKSYYAEFGIVLSHKRYVLPADRDERSASLKLMVGSMKAPFLAGNKYGLVFWTEKQTTFEALRKAKGEKDGEISSKTGIKRILRAEVKTVVNSFVYLIKANYPASYRSELRSWGFHKEKY